MSTPIGSGISVGDRIREAVATSGLDGKAFAAKAGIPYPSLRDYMTGTQPGAEALRKIAAAAERSADWLLGLDSETQPRLGEAARPEYYGPPKAGPPPERVLAAADGREFILLPRYDVSVSAGNGTVVRSEQVVDYLAFSAEWFHKNVGIAPGSAALIEVRGDSMTPVLNDGELVIVDTSCDAFKDDAVYVLQYSGALRIKNVQRRLDGKIEIKSANKDYGVETLTEQEAEAGSITIVGRARWALSGRRLP